MRFIAVLVAAGWLVSTAPASATVFRWSTFEASQRLETGRFAVQNQIDSALCLGEEGRRVGKYGEEKFRTFECKVYAPGFERERHLALTVTGPTRFRVQWLGQIAACP